MTLAGHSPAHLPQPTHRSRSTRAAIPRTIPTAPTGQTFTQHPQATQAPASTSALRRFFHTVITRLLPVFIHKTYVKFAVSMGFPKRKVLRSYALKPVLCKLTAAVSASFAWVFGGSAILEFAFGIPGISYFLIDSMKARDYNVLQTYILVVVIWMFLVHLVLGLLLRALDARGRT